MTPARGSRPMLALLVVAVLGVLGYLTHQALRASDVPFLARHAPAQWILFPHAASSFPRISTAISTTFTRSFQVATAPRRGNLQVRFARTGTVTINGEQVVLAASPEGAWKSARAADVTAHLRAGANTIVARAEVDAGPPALWLALELDGETLVSDATWQASCAGSASRPARPASTPMSAWSKPSPFSPTGELGSERLNPRASSALRSAAPRLALFAAFAAALVFAARALARRTARLSGARATALFVSVAAAAFGALFWNNRALGFDQGFDATAHAEYVNYVLARGAVPLADQGWEMYQPPLYYALAACALKLAGYTALDPSSLHVVRALGWLLLVLQTLFVTLGLRLLFDDRPRLAFIGAGFGALVPMQLYLFQYVTNECLAATLVSAALYLALRILRRDSTGLADHALLGLALGAALLTKFSALLAVVLALGVLTARLVLRRETSALVWLRTVGVAAAVTLLSCGWYYLRVHEHFGQFFVGNFDPLSTFLWWQDPGYHTSGYFARFGAALDRPLFSAFHSCADALYSSLWGDGMLGGSGRIDVRPPWDYPLMAAGALLALVPTLALALGLARALARLVREPRADWLLALGLLAATLAALIGLTLKLPFYAQCKAVYASSVMIPLCALAASGSDWLASRARALAPLVWTLLGTWALASFATFWAPTGAGVERVDVSDPVADLWKSDEAGSARLGGLPALERSVARAFDHPGAHARLSTVRLALGDTEGALAAGRDAVAIDPWNATAHYVLGRAWRAKADRPRALEQLDLAARLNRARTAREPLSVALVLELSSLLMEAERFGDALAVLERARADLAVRGAPPDAQIEAYRERCRGSAAR